MIVLHEPFYNLKKFGATDADGRTFSSCASLLAWLRDETYGISVFLKDTTDHRHDDIFADRRFLAEARHAFLIRRPEKIAASFYALAPDMSLNTIGLEIMCELQAAVDGVKKGQEPDLLSAKLARDALVLCYKECESVKTGKAVSIS